MSDFQGTYFHGNHLIDNLWSEIFVAVFYQTYCFPLTSHQDVITADLHLGRLLAVCCITQGSYSVKKWDGIILYVYRKYML